MQEHIDAYTERNATSIAIAAGQQLCELREYAERSGITYPLLADEDRSATKSYGIYDRFGMAAHNLVYTIFRPARFIIDKLGYSFYNWLGLSDHSLAHSIARPATFIISLPRSTGSFMVNCHDGANKASLSAPQGKHYLSAFLFNARGPDDDLLALSDEEITNRLREDLRKYTVPIPETPLFTRVYRWPEAVCLMPGGMLKKIDHMRRTMQASCRGLFLAGEYMRLPSVNGALISGMDAAAEVAEFLAHR